MSKELITHFAEEISHLHGNPNCKSCYGRFWTGISELPNGQKMLVKCHCVTNLGPTEYARLQLRIDEHFANLMEREELRLKLSIEAIERQSLFYRLRRWWRNRGTVRVNGSDLVFADRRGGYQPTAESAAELSSPPQGGSGVPVKK